MKNEANNFRYLTLSQFRIAIDLKLYPRTCFSSILLTDFQGTAFSTKNRKNPEASTFFQRHNVEKAESRDYLHTVLKRNSSEYFLFEFSMLIVCYLLVVCEYCGMPWRMLRICWEPFSAVLPACLFEYVDNASVAQWRRQRENGQENKTILRINTQFFETAMKLWL